MNSYLLATKVHDEKFKENTFKFTKGETELFKNAEGMTKALGTALTAEDRFKIIEKQSFSLAMKLMLKNFIKPKEE